MRLLRKEVLDVRKVMRNRRKDRKVFAHTAVVGKKVNVEPKQPRGGIRM